jgi:hypothetical protein
LLEDDDDDSAVGGGEDRHLLHHDPDRTDGTAGVNHNDNDDDNRLQIANWNDLELHHV